MTERTYIIAGPGTRKREVICSRVEVSQGGSLVVWAFDRVVSGYAAGEWASFWEKEAAK